MKYTINRADTSFNPVEVVITCESADELQVLYRKIKKHAEGGYDFMPWGDLAIELHNLI